MHLILFPIRTWTPYCTRLSPSCLCLVSGPKPKPISSPPDGPRDTSLTFSTLTLWPHSSTSPSLSLSPLATRSFDELTALSPPTIVCSSTPSSRRCMPSPILAPLYLAPAVTSLSFDSPWSRQDPDFTAARLHRRLLSPPSPLKIQVPFALLMSFSLDIDQTLTFDFNFFPARALMNLL